MVKKSFLFLLFVSFIFLFSCSSLQEQSPLIYPFVLDPVFREFYENLGGIDYLGPVISEIKIIGSLKLQYIETGLLLYELNLQDGNNVKFWPIGRQMEVEEKSLQTLSTVTEDEIFTYGHFIPKEIYQEILAIGSFQISGKPLTEFRSNNYVRRYEQYFENIGFYILFDDPKKEIHLLAYGSWQCNQDCPPGKDKYGIVDVKAPIGKPFKQIINDYGTDFTGYLLEDYQIISEKKLVTEEIFRNVVFRTNPQLNNSIELFPLPEFVGVNKEEPVNKVEIEGNIFIPTEANGKGFNVPIILLQYIKNHGDLQFIGLPINAYKKYGNVYRQCFRNLCLIYDDNEEEWHRIFPEALGYAYLRIRRSEPSYEVSENTKTYEQNNRRIFDNEDFTFEIWEESPLVSSTDKQNIYLLVKDTMNQPIEGIQSILMLNYPSKNNKLINFPKTGKEGISFIEIDPIEEENGEIIFYEVCVEIESVQYCLSKDYIIWNNP